jgi:glycosyltransferase involved in cell wall biosynthesis
MIFPFLKYVNPAWYFNLRPEKGPVYFPDYDHLASGLKEIIEWDEGYSSSSVGKLDAAYQAWNRGIILMNSDSIQEVEQVKPKLRDNYRFIRKYFHPLWSVYVLMIRLFSLHNPFAELRAFWSQRKVKRLDLCERVEDHKEGIGQFESQLIREQPLVSVIIPTLNRYTYLKDALHDLELQDYLNFEVIVVDQSEPFHLEFYEQFKLNIQLIRQEEKALWLARISAIKRSKAEYLLLYDDDSRTEPDWISQHLKCLDYFDADISSGVSLSVVGAQVPKNYSFYRWSDQLDTGNAMVKRSVFQSIGLFDRQFEKQRMGDGEFGLRAYLAGFKNISNPLAKRIHLKVGEGGLRQMGSWDAFRPKSIFAPRPVPSVLYLIRKYFGNSAALRVTLVNLPQSIIPYQYKGKKFILIFLFPFIFLYSPFLLIQWVRSWRLASGMLRQGAKIEHLA